MVNPMSDAEMDADYCGSIQHNSCLCFSAYFEYHQDYIITYKYLQATEKKALGA